jgi:amino acid transporter
VLEFVALVVLRVKEPGLARPFRVPGGLWGAVAVGVGPTLLIGWALWAARGERVAGLPALGFAAIVAVAGPMVYLAARAMGRARDSSI